MANDIKPNAMVLDPCCGSRMFWFDKDDQRAVFLDKRAEVCAWTNNAMPDGVQTATIAPDYVADFTAIPFPACHFSLVVFDPPHIERGATSTDGRMQMLYGKLTGDWREVLARGFAECRRVLAFGGTLIFKWNETSIPVKAILALVPHRPLFGQRCGKTAKTHWIVWIKDAL